MSGILTAGCETASGLDLRVPPSHQEHPQHIRVNSRAISVDEAASRIRSRHVLLRDHRRPFRPVARRRVELTVAEWTELREFFQHIARKGDTYCERNELEPVIKLARPVWRAAPRLPLTWACLRSGRVVIDTAAPNAPSTGVPQPSRLGSVVLALLINAVPLVGVLYSEWSAINVLVLYWFENLLVGFCTLIRLVAHRAWTRKRGYWRHSNRLGIQINNKPAEMGLIGEYAIGTFGLTLGHALFVGGILLLVHQNYPDQAMWQLSWPQVSRGALATAAFLGIELAVDLTRIRGASFAALRDYAQARMGRVIVLHLAIILGMFAMAVFHSPMGILYVLIGIKTCADLLGIATRGAPKIADSDTPPPAWTMRTANKPGKIKGVASDLQKQWQAEHDQARKNAIEDEQTMPDASA